PSAVYRSVRAIGAIQSTRVRISQWWLETKCARRCFRAQIQAQVPASGCGWLRATLAGANSRYAASPPRCRLASPNRELVAAALWNVFLSALPLLERVFHRTGVELRALFAWVDAVDEVVVLRRCLAPVREVDVRGLLRFGDELVVGVRHPVAVAVGHHVDNDAVLAHGLPDLLQHLRVPCTVGGTVGPQTKDDEFAQRSGIRHLLQDRQCRDVVPALCRVHGRARELLLQRVHGGQHHGVTDHADFLAGGHLAIFDRDLAAVLWGGRGGLRRYLVFLLQAFGLFLQVLF